VLESSTDFTESGRDYLNASLCLNVWIARPNQFTLCSYGRAARDSNMMPDTNRTTIGNQRFPFRSREN
jgi:hypothetical protein